MSFTTAVICSVALAAAASAAQLPAPAGVDEVDPRFLLFGNTTSLSVSLSSVMTAVLALLAVILLGGLLMVLLLGVGGDETTGYSGHSGHSGYSGASGDSGYRSDAGGPSEYQQRSLSALDWIALAEELYETADLSGEQCQQRLVCQLKRNAPAWGGAGRAASDALDYLPYLQLMKLPAGLTQLLDQFQQAVRLGRSGGADCDQLYPECGFSLRSLIDEHGPAASS